MVGEAGCVLEAVEDGEGLILRHGSFVGGVKMGGGASASMGGGGVALRK